MFDKFITLGILDRIKCDAYSSSDIIQFNNIDIYNTILKTCDDVGLYVSSIKSMLYDTNGKTYGDVCINDNAVYNTKYMKKYKMGVVTMNTFTIYGVDVFKKAVMLSNIIAEKHTRYVALTTTVKNKMFALTINNVMNMVTFINIDPTIYKSITPASGIWMPPIFELLGVYHKLYSPQHYSDHGDLKLYESDCWGAVYKSTGIKHSRNSKYQWNPLILTWLKNNDMCLLIGPTATTYGRRDTYNVQIVTSGDIPKLVDSVRVAFKRLANISNITVKKYTYDSIPGEYRMTRTVLSIKNDIVLEIYNSAQYELLPYILVDDIRVATPYVLLYYMLVNIWNINALASYGIVNKNTADSISSGYYMVMKHVRDNIFYIDTPKYIGTYISDFLYKKRLSINNPYYPYYPIRYHNIHGKYWDIYSSVSSVSLSPLSTPSSTSSSSDISSPGKTGV